MQFKTHVPRVWVFTLVVSILFALPAMATPERADAPMTEAASSSSEYACVEVASESGGLSVRECLIQSPSEGMAASQSLRIPSAMRHTIGSELLWQPHLLPPLDRGGNHEGELVRWATLEEGETVELGSHAFVSRVEIEADSIRFRLSLEDHPVSSIEGETRGDGRGRLVITSAETGAYRSLDFVDGRRVASTDPSLAERSSSFYMGCYIDTPAFDHFRPNTCYRFGTGSSVAVFKVFLPYTPSSVVWLTPSSACTGLFCSAPISAGQTVYGYAYWVINGIPTGPVSAQAIFEFEPGL